MGIQYPPIEPFQSREQQLCKIIGTKGSVYIRNMMNSHRIGLVCQHGRRFIVSANMADWFSHDVTKI